MPTGDDVSHPVPPSMVRFFEDGLREPDRWRVPLLLAIGTDVGVDDVRSVLTAVTNHHDALRLNIVERAGTWEQRIGPPQESVEVTRRTLAEGLARGKRPGARSGARHDRRRHSWPGSVTAAEGDVYL